VREAVPTVQVVRSESVGGDQRQAKGVGHACAKRYPRSGPCDQDRTEGIRPGGLNGCGRSWAQRKRVPRRTRWRGKGHESTGREGRTAVRKPWAGRSNSSEPFRPRGGVLRRAKAWASFSRGRGDTGTYSRELDRAKLAGHRASTADYRVRAPVKAKLAEHRAQ
jgi:hypothetical protein